MSGPGTPQDHNYIYQSVNEHQAVRRALRWAKEQVGGAARIAVVTDHMAIVTAQRRWYSSHGGFATGFHLNGCFEEAYSGCSTEFFYVHGELNIADAPSRQTGLDAGLRVRAANVNFPTLHHFSHPYSGRSLPATCF